MSEKVYCNSCGTSFEVSDDEIWEDIAMGDPYHGCIYGRFVNCPNCGSVIEIIPNEIEEYLKRN